ncbi:hypothetical protein Cob_v009558 [Colletotrichum orbiculare MAFF 240422]|uniref:Uncharacterized protein n=1 Tax=Colletotrichum orbiculare (strain 104-T / ATCC 96160 / CBS 514.97 / LARS 414 / MAFF 240422) TaxID=1213857 RepID=A0A484FGE5_COLOR|nr:hypothetical protein Cob_v009558 [Colletotrichum orbiculare MAFF 240422]
MAMSMYPGWQCCQRLLSVHPEPEQTTPTRACQHMSRGKRACQQKQIVTTRVGQQSMIPLIPEDHAPSEGKVDFPALLTAEADGQCVSDVTSAAQHNTPLP